MTRLSSLFSGAVLFAALSISAPAFADGHAQSGAFTGASNHVTAGAVQLVKTDDGYEIHLGEDFSFDGAPDPRVGFGNDGTFVDSTDFEPLRENEGAQVYKVPAEIDPTQYNNVFIWCSQYSVPLGYAEIN